MFASPSARLANGAGVRIFPDEIGPIGAAIDIAFQQVIAGSVDPELGAAILPLSIRAVSRK